MEMLDKLPGFAFVIIITVGLGMMGILILVATSFLKIVVVIHILKSALGLQEVPPSMLINALALCLTIYIMAPVGIQMQNIFAEYNIDVNNLKDPNIYPAAKASIKPLKRFMLEHTGESEKAFFANGLDKSLQKHNLPKIDKENLIILLPAFTTSQLKSAFQTGFMIYLPFIIIDLIVSNILLALGMIMVSPIMISLPFKLLLFVMVDGWSRLLNSLVLSYL